MAEKSYGRCSYSQKDLDNKAGGENVHKHEKNRCHFGAGRRIRDGNFAFAALRSRKFAVIASLRLRNALGLGGEGTGDCLNTLEDHYLWIDSFLILHES